MSATVAVDNEPKTKSKPITQRKKRLILPLGDKGGTSKSFIIRKLAEMHMEAQKPGLQLVDGDATTGHSTNFMRRM